MLELALVHVLLAFFFRVRDETANQYCIFFFGIAGHENSLTFSSIILCQVDTTTDRRGCGLWPASGQNYQNPICEATFCRGKIISETSSRQHSVK
ncbi:hypothetical protein [Halopseudomonas litoralis]|uniref:hypothetical protein n=1 Tax=Halopseudomonas litoralis TaxID=797277 RepID=UPI001E583290|nr:hypothetical protein [Halopseudomonas litoralis]